VPCSHKFSTSPHSQPYLVSQEHVVLTLLRPILILSTHLRLCLPSGHFPSRFPTNISLLNTIRATFPAHLILLDFITLAILGEDFFLPPVASSLCGPQYPVLKHPESVLLSCRQKPNATGKILIATFNYGQVSLRPACVRTPFDTPSCNGLAAAAIRPHVNENVTFAP
jgi:hypothetical protein